MAKPKAIDLFSGCGGLSLGLKAAGFRVIAAVDAEPLAIKTYRKNHRGTRAVLGDIRRLDPVDELRKSGLEPGELDLLAGCPPCQGFSALRTMNGRLAVDDEQNDLLFEFLRFVEAMKPKAIMLENVPGLLKDQRLSKFGARIKKLGYRFDADVFDASRFGVPQRRKRMILIALKGATPQFAQPSSDQFSVADAIKNLPHPNRSRDPAHRYTVRREKNVKALIRKIPKNGGSRSALSKRHQLKCHTKTDGFKDVYGRLHWDEPSATITSGCINPSKGRFLHPSQNRAITLREAALLQGFPHNYEFDLSRGRYPVALLIGNAFPPEFARRHARQLRIQLTESEKRSNIINLFRKFAASFRGLCLRTRFPFFHGLNKVFVR